MTSRAGSEGLQARTVAVARRGAAWFGAAGTLLGGVAGTLDWPVVGTFFGAVEGGMAGAVAGVVIGLVLVGLSNRDRSWTGGALAADGERAARLRRRIRRVLLGGSGAG